MFPNGDTAFSTRRCLTCEVISDELLCPSCGMSTFKRGLPAVDAGAVSRGMVIAQRYRVQGAIGSGGNGAVFAVRHTATDQELALKVLDVAGGPSDAGIKRFFQEAKVTAGLKHPNTVRVFDFGQDDSGVVFIAMERLVGRTLSEELRSRVAAGWAFTDREASRLGVEILKSLAEAHAAGLVHRDLKPANIFLHEVDGEEPAVKVLDFGIAKVDGVNLSRAGWAPCTPEFASPEQASGAIVDARSDLYALGVVLFKLVTGELPFAAKVRRDILTLHMQASPPNLRTWPGVSLDPEFIDIVERALAKSADDRFADAVEMRVALEGWSWGPDEIPGLADLAVVADPGPPEQTSAQEVMATMTRPEAASLGGITAVTTAGRTEALPSPPSEEWPEDDVEPESLVTEAMVTKASVTKASVTKASVTKASVTKASVTKASQTRLLATRVDAPPSEDGAVPEAPPTAVLTVRRDIDAAPPSSPVRLKVVGAVLAAVGVLAAGAALLWSSQREGAPPPAAASSIRDEERAAPAHLRPQVTPRHVDATPSAAAHGSQPPRPAEADEDERVERPRRRTPERKPTRVKRKAVREKTPSPPPAPAAPARAPGPAAEPPTAPTTPDPKTQKSLLDFEI